NGAHTSSVIAHPGNAAPERVAADGVAIAHDPPRRSVVRERFNHLLCAAHAAVGWSVIARWTTRRRWWARRPKTNSTRPVRVGTVKKSIETRPPRDWSETCARFASAAGVVDAGVATPFAPRCRCRACAAGHESGVLPTADSPLPSPVRASEWTHRWSDVPDISAASVRSNADGAIRDASAQRYRAGRKPGRRASPATPG